MFMSIVHRIIYQCPHMPGQARHLRPFSSLLFCFLIKARIASRHARSRNAPPIRIPDLFCTSCAKNLSMLMGAALTNRRRFVKMSAYARACPASASVFLAALIRLYHIRLCVTTLYHLHFTYISELNCFSLQLFQNCISSVLNSSNLYCGRGFLSVFSLRSDQEIYDRGFRLFASYFFEPSPLSRCCIPRLL